MSHQKKSKYDYILETTKYYSDVGFLSEKAPSEIRAMCLCIADLNERLKKLEPSDDAEALNRGVYTLNKFIEDHPDILRPTGYTFAHGKCCCSETPGKESVERGETIRKGFEQSVSEQGKDFGEELAKRIVRDLHNEYFEWCKRTAESAKSLNEEECEAALNRVGDSISENWSNWLDHYKKLKKDRQEAVKKSIEEVTKEATDEFIELKCPSGVPAQWRLVWYIDTDIVSLCTSTGKMDPLRGGRTENLKRYLNKKYGKTAQNHDIITVFDKVMGREDVITVEKESIEVILRDDFMSNPLNMTKNLVYYDPKTDEFYNYFGKFYRQEAWIPPQIKEKAKEIREKDSLSEGTTLRFYPKSAEYLIIFVDRLNI